MLYLAPAEVRRLKPRHDVCGTLGGHHDVDIACRCDYDGAGVSECDLERRRSYDDHVIADISEYVGRLGEQAGWRDDFTTIS